MSKFVNGERMILDGVLRVMPSRLENIAVDTTVSAVESQLQRADAHIQAGRMPILKKSTKGELVERAQRYEIEKYGKPLRTDTSTDSLF